MSKPETIIVGAGSAGCLLAHLLSAQRRSVVLIEPPSETALPIDRQRPARWLQLLGSQEDWDLLTAPNKNLAGRSIGWPRGRGLGGSSRINAMIWFPPTDDDLSEFASVTRFSKPQLERSLAEVESIIKPEAPRWLSPSSQAFRQATESLSHGRPMVYRRMNRRGRRWNPAELLDRQDVEVVRAGVERVIFEGGKASGVQLIGGEEITCGGSVILCAGAIATPMILKRSGIGPADLLGKCNIDVRVGLAGVGANLQDHLVMPVIFGVDATHQFAVRPSPRDIACWQTVGSGPLSSNIAECGGLFKDGRIQIHVTPTHFLTHPDPSAAAAMTVAVNATQPKSRGRLSISAADPAAEPIIEPDYLADEDDLKTTIEGVRLAREIVQLDPLTRCTTGELLPGGKRQSAESIARSIARYARTLYHPVGTCAAGDVVDEHLQVHGADGLHVVDASVLKSVTTGNPNAMVMTVAHAFACSRK